jgi:cobalt/nickel transport system permease protein
LVCETFTQEESLVHRLDPRPRVVVALVFTVVLALSREWDVLGTGLAVSLAGWATARLPVIPVLKRLAGVNLFLAVLALVLPLSARAPSLFSVGPLSYSRAGALQVLQIALKCNAIVLALTVLLSTMEVVELGHALSHLRVPHKLAHLFLFTIRYIDLVHHEYSRLRKAMRVRCFRPGVNRHTYRTIGHLLGMLLVRSFDRSERVMAAMKCRCFRGEFYVLRHFSFQRRDVIFSIACTVLILLLGLAECL